MTFLKALLLKFRVFHLFFSILIGLGFLFFSSSILENPLTDILHFAVGFLIAFSVAIFISFIYERVADGTFHKVRIFYLAEGIVLPLTFYASVHYSFPGFVNVIIFGIFILIQILAVVFTVWIFRTTIWIALFYLVGLFIWFYFITLYYRNIIDYFYVGC